MGKCCQAPSTRELIERTLHGDEGAFGQLQRRHRRDLERYVGRELCFWFGRRPRRNGYQSDDVTSAVLNALWSRNYRYLRAYDPGRGSLAKYLRGLARRRIRWLVLGRSRRPKGKPIPMAERVASPSLLGENILLDEIRARLTPQPARFFETELLGRRGAGRASYSATNSRKLRSRIRPEAEAVVYGLP